MNILKNLIYVVAFFSITFCWVYKLNAYAALKQSEQPQSTIQEKPKKTIKIKQGYFSTFVTAYKVVKEDLIYLELEYERKNPNYFWAGDVFEFKKYPYKILAVVEEHYHSETLKGRCSILFKDYHKIDTTGFYGGQLDFYKSLIVRK